MTMEVLLYSTGAKVFVYGSIILFLILWAVAEELQTFLGLVVVNIIVLFAFLGPFLAVAMVEVNPSPLSDLVGTILGSLWIIGAFMVVFLLCLYAPP
jgi:hypothetical protein